MSISFLRLNSKSLSPDFIILNIYRYVKTQNTKQIYFYYLDKH